MNHTELCELWQKKNERFKIWRDGLFKVACDIHARIEETLQLSEKHWKDNEHNAPIKYVSLLNISVDEPLHQFFSKDSITDNGEFLFRLRIYLDHGLQTYPKAPYDIALAVRYLDDKPEFSIFNRGDMQAKKWNENIDQFAESIIRTLAENLSFDPFKGQPKQAKIGFIESTRSSWK